MSKSRYVGNPANLAVDLGDADGKRLPGGHRGAAGKGNLHVGEGAGRAPAVHRVEVGQRDIARGDANAVGQQFDAGVAERVAVAAHPRATVSV